MTQENPKSYVYNPHIITENDEPYIANNMVVESLPQHNSKLKHFASSQNINMLNQYIYESK